MTEVPEVEEVAETLATLKRSEGEDGSHASGVPEETVDAPSFSSRGWSCDDGLTACTWMHQLQPVLHQLTLLGGQPSRRPLLAPLLAFVSTFGGEALQQRFVRVLEVNEVMALSDRKEQDEAACELYELLNHTVIPTTIDKQIVYGEQRGLRTVGDTSP